MADAEAKDGTEEQAYHVASNFFGLERACTSARKAPAVNEQMQLKLAVHGAPEPSEISLVSSGLYLFSSAKPGVSTSGGSTTDT